MPDVAEPASSRSVRRPAQPDDAPSGASACQYDCWSLCERRAAAPVRCATSGPTFSATAMRPRAQGARGRGARSAGLVAYGSDARMGRCRRTGTRRPAPCRSRRALHAPRPAPPGWRPAAAAPPQRAGAQQESAPAGIGMSCRSHFCTRYSGEAATSTMAARARRGRAPLGRDVAQRRDPSRRRLTEGVARQQQRDMGDQRIGIAGQRQLGGVVGLQVFPAPIGVDGEEVQVAGDAGFVGDLQFRRGPWRASSVAAGV